MHAFIIIIITSMTAIYVEMYVSLFLCACPTRLIQFAGQLPLANGEHKGRLEVITSHGIGPIFLDKLI